MEKSPVSKEDLRKRLRERIQTKKVFRLSENQKEMKLDSALEKAGAGSVDDFLTMIDKLDSGGIYEGLSEVIPEEIQDRIHKIKKIRDKEKKRQNKQKKTATPGEAPSA